MKSNKDIEQIKKFEGWIPYSQECRQRTPEYERHVQSVREQIKDGDQIYSPEEAYIQKTSLGKTVETYDPKEYRRLLDLKRCRDTWKKEYTHALKRGLFTVDEIIETVDEDFVFDCMKDIVKTTDRMQIIEDGSYHFLEFYNRNWFINKLNLKYPENFCGCEQCKETYWKSGQYVTEDEVKEICKSEEKK